MNFSRPNFSADTSSIISTVTGLHSYFRDLQSYYKIIKGKLLGELEATLGELEATNDEAQTEVLKQKLQDTNEKINYFHLLNNSISTVDIVLHTEFMIKEFAHKGKE